MGEKKGEQIGKKSPLLFSEGKRREGGRFPAPAARPEGKCLGRKIVLNSLNGRKRGCRVAPFL